MNLSALPSGQLMALFQGSARILRDRGLLSHAADNLYCRNTGNFQDEEFERLYALCVASDTRGLLGSFENPHDKAFRWRLHILLTFSSRVAKQGLHMLDLGCGSGLIASAVLANSAADFRKRGGSYFMFDSFSGATPVQGETNGYSPLDGAYAQALSICDAYDDIAQLTKGYLPMSLHNLPVDILKNIGLVSLDLNSAKAEIETMSFLFPYLHKGCIVILDDFGFPDSLDQNTAFRLFAEKNLVNLVHLPTGQGLLLI